MKNKRAGFEMSITTLVVIVIAVVMLILGLVLVRQIFRGATESMSIMEAGMMDKVRDIFGEEGGTISLFSKTISVKPDTMGFRIPVGFHTQEGRTVTEENMEFTIEVVQGGAKACGKEKVETWIEFPPITTTPSDAFSKVEGNIAGLDIVISVPKNTQYCTQLIRINVYFNNEKYSHDTITLNVARGGIFG